LASELARDVPTFSLCPMGLLRLRLKWRPCELFGLNGC
jgi:hypothetical protein